MALTVRQSYLLGTTPEPARTVAPAILRKRVMTSQPQFGVGIATSNVFGARVIDALVGASPVTAKGKPVTPYGTLLRGAYPGGYGYKSSGAGGFGFPSNLTSENGITIVFEYTQHSRSGTQVLFEHSVNQNVNAGTFIAYTDSATGRLNYGQSSGGSGYDAGYITAPSLGQKTTLAIRLRFTTGTGVADIAIAVNGELKTTTSTNNNAAVINFGNYQTYFLSRAGSSLFSNATFGCYAVLKGFASDGELAALSSNPYQIFLAPNAQPWVATP